MAALDDAMREHVIVKELAGKALDADACLRLPDLTERTINWLRARRNAALDELVAREVLDGYRFIT